MGYHGRRNWSTENQARAANNGSVIKAWSRSECRFACLASCQQFCVCSLPSSMVLLLLTSFQSSSPFAHFLPVWFSLCSLPSSLVLPLLTSFQSGSPFAHFLPVWFSFCSLPSSLVLPLLTSFQSGSVFAHFLPV